MQSRYYDPEVGRFINADSFASTGQGFIGFNMYAYCGNSPICRKDASGTDWEDVVDWFKKKVKDEAEEVDSKVKLFRAGINFFFGDFTCSLGINLSAAFLLGGSASYGVAFDGEGSICEISSMAVGGGTPNASAGLVINITTAKSVSDLEGASFQAGGSASIGPVSIGGEVVMFTGAKSGKFHSGGSAVIGVGVPFIPVEAHGELAYTKIKNKINLYSIWSTFYDAVEAW